MIRTALEFIKKELDSFIAQREEDTINYREGTNVILPSLDNPGDTIKLDATAHVTIILVGVEEERSEGNRPHFLPAENNQFIKLNPPVTLELSLLVAAHKPDYPTSLRDLSDVAAFFQSNPVFDAAHYPSLNSSVTDPEIFPWRQIERLSFRLHNTSFDQQNNIWSMIGLKYMPCLLYKMRLITLFERKAKEMAPGITELSIDEKA